MARQPAGWHPEDIKAELRKRFGPVTKLSAAWGYATNMISLTLLRKNNSTLVERRIADALGIPLHVLWPDRWSPEGARLPRPRAGEDHEATPVPNVSHRQKRKAA